MVLILITLLIGLAITVFDIILYWGKGQTHIMTFLLAQMFMYLSSIIWLFNI